MAETTRFNIVFDGRLVPGTDPGKARQDIQTLFNLSDATVEMLFSGEPVTVRQQVDSETASRYWERFRKAGLAVKVFPVAYNAESIDDRQSPGQPGIQSDLIVPTQAAPPTSRSRIDKIFHQFERSLAAVLLLLISIVTVIAVIELCIVLYRDLTSQKGFLLDLAELFEVFGTFMIVLIAIEFMASIYMYMMDKSVHVEIMLLIAITALARKVLIIDLDQKAEDPLYLLSLAGLLATLIGGYYLVKRLRSYGIESDGH